jgi:protein O-GlcNAc transferase
MLPAAAEALARAAALAPADANAQLDLGIVLRQLGRLAEAEACCRRVLAARPDLAEAHNNLGNILHDLGRATEAEASFRRVLALRPDRAEAHCNLGAVLRELGRHAEAEDCYRRALGIRPDYAEAQGRLLYSLNYQSKPAVLCLEEARKYGRMLSARAARRHGDWACSLQPGRLRVGLVSGDLRNHPVGTSSRTCSRTSTPPVWNSSPIQRC